MKNDDKPVFESVQILDKKLDQSEKEERKAERINSDDLLREKVSTFIVSEMNTIEEQNAFRSLVTNAMTEKVALREVDFKDLMSLYNSISNQKANNTQVLLDIFKPTANTNNPLIRPKNEEESSNELQQFIENTDSKTMQGLFLIMKKLEGLKSLGKEEDLENNIIESNDEITDIDETLMEDEKLL